MMRLKHANYRSEILLESERQSILICENRKEFVRLISDLISLSQGEESDFVLSENYEILCGESILEIIPFPMDLNFKSKKIQQGVVKSVIKKLQENFLTFQEFFLEGYRKLWELTFESDVKISISQDFDPADMAKYYKIEAAMPEGALPRRLASYVNALCEFTKVKLLVTVNLNLFLDKEEMQAFHQHCLLKEMKLLRLEGFCEDLGDNENSLIIDKDLCEILVKGNEIV